jgi:hypothetical protein
VSLSLRCSSDFEIAGLVSQVERDIVYNTQTQLPQNLRTLFGETLRPDLIAVLRENLLPLNTGFIANYNELQNTYHDKLVSEISQNYHNLSSDIDALKERINNPYVIKGQIQSTFSQPNFLSKARLEPNPFNDGNSSDDTLYTQESLKEV